MSEKIQGVALQNASTLLSSLSGEKKTGSEAGGLPELLGRLSADGLELSDDSRQKIQWAKAQFELSYQTIRSLNSSQGIETTQQTFSFRGSYEFLQKVSGHDLPAGSADQPENAEGKPTTSEDALEKLNEYFSPENTAGRILDIALSFFGASDTLRNEGDTQPARRKFADFIGAAIESGFRQAMDILGRLPENVENGVNKTHSLVFSGLEDFVTNGIAREKLAPGGVMEKIAAYRLEISQQIETAGVSRSGGSVGYTSRGDAKTTEPDTSTISTKG